MSGLDLTTAFPVSYITDSVTAWFVTLAPYIELLSGVLLALFVLKYLISSFNTDKNKNDIQ